jgi:asparagine synthase (glutamine-hydrolysing)
MCGIVGFCDYKKQLTYDNLEDMTQVLERRGPDASGVNFLKFNECNVGLGHRRLSILDLSENGSQPYSFENLTLVYNGEIYNYKEIESELIKLGYNFDSNSDTEVLIKAFHCWGLACLEKLIGMFAFGIFDKETQKITLVRDRAGVKPLYFFFEDGLLLFASELRSFLKVPFFKRNIDKNSLMLYFQYGYIPSPNSIFENVRKLKAGHILEFDVKDKSPQEIQYWNPSEYYQKEKLDISFQEATTHLEGLLKSSFEYRKVSDVPLGVFLSGGYDSSVVAAMLQSSSISRIKTFTIGFDSAQYNEAVYAKKIANYLGTDHCEYYCTERDALDMISNIADVYDEPFGDTSAIPTLLLSKFSREKVTVALSADGGDELFAGYDIYRSPIYENQFLNKFKFLSPVFRLVNPKYISIISKPYNIEGKFYKFSELLTAKSSLEKFDVFSKYFYKEELGKLLNYKFHHQSIFTATLTDQDDDKQQLLLSSFERYLTDDIMVKVDRASMYYGLEAREPLLDHRIFEFLAQLPYKYKYKNGQSKVILREIAHKYIPQEMIDRKKQGFSIPLDSWLRGELKESVLDTLSRLKRNNDLFNSSYIDQLIDSFYKHNGNPYKLWLLFTFQLWYERWMNE